MFIKKGIIIILLLVLCACSKTNEVIVNERTLSTVDTDTYYGYLVIPAIEMKLGFFSYDSSLNTVSKNVELIDTGIKNTYLLAAHSGIGPLAYFNDLRYLKENDDVYLEFKNKTLHYKVSNIKSETKTGSLKLKNVEEQIVLTTCDQIKKGNQLIIEGYLVNED